MSDLLSELDDVMRRERMEKLWKEYGSTIIAGIILAIFLTAAISGFKAWDHKAKTESTTQLIALLESPQFPNVKESDLDMRASHESMARLIAAATYVRQDKTAEALALYDQVLADKSAPSELRDFARLMRARLLSQEQAYESVLESLAPLLNNQGSVWRFHAQLEAASLLAHGAKDYARAREHLAAILEAPGLPETLYAKARALDHIYALKQSESQPQQPDQDS